VVAVTVAMTAGIADAKDLNEQRWRRRANATCEQFHEDRNAILPEHGLSISTSDEALPYVDQAVPLYEGLIRAIDSLAEPRSRVKGVKSFLNPLKAAVRTIEENPLAAFSGFEDPFATANQAAARLRLRSCVRLGNQRI
jgi:hypothetical protein